MIKKTGLVLMMVLCITTLSGVAQESSPVVNRSTTIQWVDGKEYFFHAVLPGQTLFSISRAYGVTIDEITAENPEIQNNELRFDQIIKIPVKQALQSNAPPSITITETTYFNHQVRRRETVYGIARIYGITDSDLMEHNPQARSGLRPNMILKIPRQRQTQVYYREYVVPPRQTLFSLTRELDITVEELERLNPELKDGLKADQVLKIPVEYISGVQPPFVEVQNIPQIPEYQRPEPKPSDPFCNNPDLKRQYNVALLIPLYLENIDEEGEVADPNKTFAFLEYYQGMMIAIDSIRKLGADIKLTVYDVDNTPVKARNAIWKPEMARMDLIIGPFFPDIFPIVADFAKSRNIPVVSPLHSDDQQLLTQYPNMFQVVPDISTQMLDMAEFIANTYPNENILLVHNDAENIRNRVFSFRNYLNNEINNSRFQKDSSNLARIGGYFLNNGVYVGEKIANVSVINDSIRDVINESTSESLVSKTDYMSLQNVKEVIYTQGGMNSLHANFDSTRVNIIVSLMGNEAMIANYTRQLYNLRDSYSLVLFGVPQWRDYTSMDYNHMQSLNTHLFAPDFIDYTRPNVSNYIRRYRALNHVEPGTMGVRAVETGMFFFTALWEYGSEFTRCIDIINQKKGASTPFLFSRENENAGWENQFVYLIRFKDYRLINAKSNSDPVASEP